MPGGGSSRRQARLLRRYAAVFVGLVGAALLASGVVQAVFSYVDSRDTILRVQQDAAGAAAATIGHLVTQTEGQLQVALQQVDPHSVPGYSAANVSDEERRAD